jgi:N-acetylglucosamine malate deacetylase 1
LNPQRDSQSPFNTILSLKMKLDILAIGVHPDDVELACSGTLLHHIALGKKIGLLDLTRGERGTRGSADLRDMEAANSAMKMGALVRENLCMADCFFEHTPENINAIISVIRQYQPEIVLTNSINDRHPDHGRAAKLTADACFYAGLAKIETQDKQGKAQERWRPKAVYHYIQDFHIEPDFVTNVTPYWEKKIELIMTFRSQFFDADTETGELNTPISGADFLHYVEGRARDFGRPAGFEFAEGFKVGRTIGVENLFDLS